VRWSKLPSLPTPTAASDSGQRSRTSKMKGTCFHHDSHHPESAHSNCGDVAMITSGLSRANPADASRHTERRVVTNPLVRFSVRQRPQPRANDAYPVDGFRMPKPVQPRAPILGHDAGRMVGKSGEDGHFVPHPCPMPRQLVGARRGRSHLRGKVLRNVEDFHGFNYDF